MHPALEIPDVIDEICSHIVPNYPGMRDLARLARTTHIFQDPALNLLWRWQGTFANLLRCIPADVWNIPVEKGSVDALVCFHLGNPFYPPLTAADQELARPIMPVDWQRALLYFQRVKTLYADSVQELPSREVFEILTSYLPVEHLFPNLRSLTWYHDHFPDLCPYIRTVAGPRLSRLEIQFHPTMSHLSVLSSIAVKCPHITDVEISCSGFIDSHRLNADETRACMSSFLRGLKSLERLKLWGPDLDLSTYEHLASLSTFKYLDLENLHYFPPFTTLPSSDTRSSGLTTVKIWLTNIEVARFIRFWSGAPLADVDMLVSVHSLATLAAIPELFCAIAASIPRTALRSLIFTISCSYFDPPAHSSLPPPPMTIAAALQQLFCFPNITILNLRLCEGFGLDDSIVLQMARAWPALRFLNLASFGIDAEEEPRVTLAAFPVFAQYCPELRSLGILINALGIPSTPSNSLQPAVRGPVTMLDVGYAPIGDPAAVASFIFAVFPHVSEIRTGPSQQVFTREENLQFESRWETVERLLAHKRRTSS
ncbi:hypothetical protein B0H19DRAFT_1077947 [Mycena capillaripes]|nr:hypothetical protein B0H19DRAFT_1077947 [Mycena capillaripes]